MAVVRLPVIVGPTGVGKTQVAVALARLGPITVISADSRQIYQGFDIGTAKPTDAERRAAPHQGIDVADASDRWSAPQWAAAALRWIDDARHAGRQPVVVGGTGFYVRALFEPIFEEPAMDPQARLELAGRLAAVSTEALRERVRIFDPSRASFGRTQLLRAMEVFELTGTPISVWHARSARLSPFSARYLVLDAQPAVLNVRLESRLTAMLGGGWLAEVRRLEGEVAAGAAAWQATGYHALRQVVAGAIDLTSAREQILTSTRQYAKRQRTWFRHQLRSDDVTHVDAAAPPDVVSEQVHRWWAAEARQ